jgi:hypothetical protein
MGIISSGLFAFPNPVPAIQQHTAVHGWFRKDVCLKICTGKCWGTFITNCRRNGDNAETKTVGGLTACALRNQIAMKPGQSPPKIVSILFQGRHKSVTSFAVSWRPALVCILNNQRVQDG